MSVDKAWLDLLALLDGDGVLDGEDRKEAAAGVASGYIIELL